MGGLVDRILTVDLSLGFPVDALVAVWFVVKSFRTMAFFFFRATLVSKFRVVASVQADVGT
jgi:hypothetical protein